MLASRTLSAAWIALSLTATAQGAVEVPAHTGWVVDQAGVLSSSERRGLELLLQDFHRSSGRQVEALIVQSLKGEAIEAFSIRVADRWAVGDRKRDDGVLLVVAVGDRQVRIEVGQGLEGELPDALASRLIRGVMIPYFQAGQYADGVRAGLSGIISALGGAVEAPEKTYQAGARTSTSIRMILFLLIFFWFFSRWGRSIIPGSGHLSRRSGGWVGSGWGRGGLGGGGLGGFRGGGGGFSGGGASGRW